MCQKTLLVPIPDFLVADYKYIFDSADFGPSREFDIDGEGRQCFALDACIVPAVLALWDAGIRSTGCCCGHGSGHGMVSIEVPNDNDTERRDRQIQSFYERVSNSVGGEAHRFRGSKYEEEPRLKQEHETLSAEA